MPTEFTVNSRYVLLTYAQCGSLDPFDVSNHLSDLHAECIIGRERHADGGIHLHALVDFGKKKRSRRSDYFDVGGRHPNIEAISTTPWAAYDYATKDGEVCAGGLARPKPSGARDSERSTERRTSVNQRWAYICMAGSGDDFWSRCREVDPQRLCCSFSNLQRYAEWAYRVEPTPYESPAGLQFSQTWLDEVSTWLLQSGVGDPEPRVGKPEFSTRDCLSRQPRLKYTES